MEIVIITGMSGAGKTSVLNICQDNNYYSVDNIPPKLISEYFEQIRDKAGEYNKFAFVIDIRVGYFLGDLQAEVNKLKEMGHEVKVIFLDASDDELIKRYQEKRRPHPIKNLTLGKAIEKEREQLMNIREFSDVYIDTSGNVSALLNNKILSELGIKKTASIHIVSFGFKYGNLKEADMLFDVRFIDNPFYIPELKNESGLHKGVYDYVMSFEESNKFVEKIEELVDLIVPGFVVQKKNNLVIGIGCTGGQHRSVAIAERLKELLSKKYEVNIYHREENSW